MPEMPVTADDIRRAKWLLAAHINNGEHGHQYVYTCAAFPEAGVSRGWVKERGRRTTWAEFRIKVGGRIEAVPVSDLDEAARVISLARRHEQDEREWEAAAPAKAHG